jgi:hypothetical protein
MAELGYITRFSNPRQLTALLGLVPPEHSGGGTRRQGGRCSSAHSGVARRSLRSRNRDWGGSVCHRWPSLSKPGLRSPTSELLPTDERCSAAAAEVQARTGTAGDRRGPWPDRVESASAICRRASQTRRHAGPASGRYGRMTAPARGCSAMARAAWMGLVRSACHARLYLGSSAAVAA